ncbi:MAG: ABC transporter permease [Desulfobacterales bacterium]
MEKTLKIFKHEFLNMITKTGYIVITSVVLALPLVFLLASGIFAYVEGLQGTPVEEEITIGFVDNTGAFEAYTIQGEVTLLQYDTQDEVTQALVSKEIEEYFTIPADYQTTGVVQRFTVDKEVGVPQQVSSAIRRFLLSNLVEGQLPPAVVDRIYDPLRITTTTLTETGELSSDQGSLGAIIMPIAFSLLIGISLMSLSTFLLQSLGEEKENRLMEVLLSSVSTEQLLAGKVLGIGAAGLIQVLIWLLLPAFLLNYASSTLLSGVVRSLLIPTDFLFLAIAYFILGYLFFGVLSAGIAAICPTSRDGAQLSMGFLMPMFVPLWLSSLIMFYPDNPLWTALTFFPITAPTMVMVRYGVTNIPAWEIAVSISVMVLATIGGLFLAAKVFRMYLLMYGKRPSLGEVIRTLRSR